MNFKNKIILITGASSGIGKQTAIEFAKKGANLILVARRKNKLELIANELEKFNITILVCQCDVSDKVQVKNMSKIVLEKFGTLDILVNNAGFAIYGSVSELSIDEIESQMKTNYFGMIYCIKNFLPHMLKKKSGHIVNVASVAASFGLPGITSYCGSKFAMLGFSEGLKHELKNSGVDITVVSPIMVKTNFFNHSSFEKMSSNFTFSLNSKTVAKSILQASNSPRLEIIVPSFMRGVIWLKNTFPYFINPIMGKLFKNLSDSKNSH